MQNTQIQEFNEFNDNLQLIMDELRFNTNAEDRTDFPKFPNKVRALFGLIDDETLIQPDKWDVIAALILAAVATATIIGISAASYYIITGLSAQGVFSATAATKLLEEGMDTQAAKKLVLFIQQNMDWVLDTNPLTEIKQLHYGLKCFLIDTFQDEESFEEFLLSTDDNETKKPESIVTKDLIQFD